MRDDETITTLRVAPIERASIPVVTFNPFTAPEASNLSHAAIGNLTPGQVIAIEDPKLKPPHCHRGNTAYAVLALALRVEDHGSAKLLHVLNYRGEPETVEFDATGPHVFDSNTSLLLSPLSPERANGVLEVVGFEAGEFESPLLVGIRALARYYRQSSAPLSDI